MRILHVMAGNEHGGAETACIDIVLAMHDAGQDVALITRPNPQRNKQLESAGITVHTLPFGGPIDLYTPWKIRRIIKNFAPDIVQTWMSRAAAKTPRWSKSICAKPYVTVGRMGNNYKLKYFGAMDYFIGVTPLIAKYIENEGIAPARIRHINNFAETEEVETPLNRADYNTPDSAALLLGLGRLHDDKAYDTLIKAVSKMPDDVYLWIAGEGPDRAKLEALIDSLGLQSRVQLLGWRNDRAALLQACDICTFTSRDEPFGTVFVQAWAQKTPVIVSDADGPRQFVRDGVDGLITPIDDEAAIIDAVQKIRSDLSLQDILTENGYERYRKEFTKEKCVQDYLDFYRVIAQNAA